MLVFVFQVVVFPRASTNLIIGTRLGHEFVNWSILAWARF